MSAPRIVDTAQISSVVLAAGDSDVLVTAPITVADSSPPSIGINVAAGAGGLIDLASSITAQRGVDAPSSTQAGAYNVTIRSGAVLAAQVLGISLFQDGSIILNDGEIRAPLGTGIRLVGPGAHAITNNGVVNADSAILLDAFRATSHTITNSGQISGLFRGVEFTNAGASYAGAIVVNSGTITAGDTTIRFAGGNNSLTNTGTIVATGIGSRAIAGSFGNEGNETIVNDGTIAGLIDLGRGTDLLDNRHGTVTGWIGLGSGNDTFLGGAGDETIEEGYGGGDDSIEGGGGNDTVSYEYLSNAPVTVDLRITVAQNTGSGMDVLHGLENVIGASRADVLIGDDMGNVLSGLLGGDNLSGGGGNDTLEGGLDNDLLDGGNGNDTAVFTGTANAAVDLSHFATQTTGYGDDRLVSIENVTSGDGNDRLTGSIVANVLIANNGQDRLKGAAGNDTLDGGGGSDVLSGGTDDDLLKGGGDDDVLAGDAGNDSLGGDAGDDLLIGGAGDDTLDGGGGNDTIIGSGQDVAVFSVASTDYALTKNADGTLIVSSLDGADELQGVRFGRFSDKTVALVNEAPDAIALSKTTVAENVLVTTVVADLSARDADGDAITYSLTDTADGTFELSGDNTLILAKPLDFETRTQYSFSVTAADAWGGATLKTFTFTVEDVPDTMPVDQPLVLRGTSGADRLMGQGLNDILTGLASNDALFGSGGNDILSGGTGKDALVGGLGKDIFVFDAKPGKTSADRIPDFSVADDTIHLAKSVFTKIGKKGVMAKTAFWVGEKAHDSTDRVIYNKKTGALFYDSDGTGKASALQFATLPTKLLLKALDFFVV